MYLSSQHSCIMEPNQKFWVETTFKGNFQKMVFQRQLPKNGVCHVQWFPNLWPACCQRRKCLPIQTLLFKFQTTADICRTNINTKPSNSTLDWDSDLFETKPNYTAAHCNITVRVKFARMTYHKYLNIWNKKQPICIKQTDKSLHIFPKIDKITDSIWTYIKAVQVLNQHKQRGLKNTATASNDVVDYSAKWMRTVSY